MYWVVVYGFDCESAIEEMLASRVHFALFLAAFDQHEPLLDSMFGGTVIALLVHRLDLQPSLHIPTYLHQSYSSRSRTCSDRNTSRNHCVETVRVRREPMFRPDIGYRCSDIVRLSDDDRRARLGVVLGLRIPLCPQIPATLSSGIVRLSFDDRRSTVYWVLCRTKERRSKMKSR
jgi:hypothetical protein